MFDFEKPKIEIAEISEDKTYGRFVVEPIRERLRYNTWKLFKTYHAFFFTGRCSKPGQD